MSKIKKLVILSLIVVFAFSLLVTTGCSRHPNEKQIQAMEEARSACLAAEQKLNEVQKDRSGLESQLQMKKAELDKAQKEKAHVEQGLSTWKDN